MKSSDMVRELCRKENVTIAELARRVGQTPQNFGKKLNRDTLTFDEMLQIAETMGVSYEQSFMCSNGEKIRMGN